MGGFLIADFAHHDFVRVMAEDGAEAAREGEALFLIDGNLRDAFELVFDGIFDGDDLVFVVFNLTEGGVEGGGFAGAGGAGDKHHAVGFGNVAAEFGEVSGTKTNHVQREFGELFAHGFFIEHTEHGIFAVDGGHDGDAEIDEATFVADAETTVLGDAALGDVEFAHDLDAGNDGGVPVFRDGGHGVVEDAVDAVFDDDFLVSGFDVDVAGAAFEGVEDGGVDELDDGGDVAVAGGEFVDGEGFFGIFVVPDDVEREAFSDFFKDALGLLGFFEEVANLGGGGDADAEFFVEK